MNTSIADKIEKGEYRIDTRVTKAQLDRVQRDRSDIAGETLSVMANSIDGPVYAFGSELGCLRLFYKMRIGRAQFSQNMNAWYYCNK